MENAVDALYMGFAILVFVIALSISIFSFTEVANASQRIIDARDKTTLYNYYKSTKTNREVSKEDIIPTLYRIYYEDYGVKFEFKNSSIQLFKINEDGKENYTNTIELSSRTNIGNYNIANSFIDDLLGKNKSDINKGTIKNISYYIEYLPTENLYDILNEKKFEESIGIYYMEDKDSNVSENGQTIDDVNKTKKRLITYTEKQDTSN